MRTVKKGFVSLLAGVITFALVIPAFAQDATGTPDGSESNTEGSLGTLNCDSSVILLAGLAQRYFDFAPSDLVLGDYVYGQYSPLFDSQDMTVPTSEATADVSSEATMEATSEVSTEVTVETTAEVATEATADVSSEATIEATSDVLAEATADVSSEATAEATSDSSSGVNSTPASSSVFLNPPVIVDEDPACTQLRTSLESFFSTKLQSGEWDADFRNGMNSNSTGS